MRSYARGTKAVLPGKLAREVCEAHFCSITGNFVSYWERCFLLGTGYRLKSQAKETLSYYHGKVSIYSKSIIRVTGVAGHRVNSKQKAGKEKENGYEKR